MIEQIHNSEQLHNLPPMSPEAGEFLAHKETEANNREARKINLNQDGAPKAMQETMAEISKAVQSDRLEHKPELDEQHRILNEIIDIDKEIEHPQMDPADAIDWLSKHIN